MISVQTSLAAGIAATMLIIAAPLSATAQSSTGQSSTGQSSTGQSNTAIASYKIAAADSAPERREMRKGHKMRHGRHGRHHRRAFGFSCGPRAEKRGARLTGLIDDLFDLNAKQQQAYDKLKSAMKDGRTQIKQVCDSLPKKQMATKDKGKRRTAMNFLQRLENREKMMTAQLASLKNFRPAFAEFYNGLSEKQRRGLNRIMSRGRHHRR